ncbi:uncharacterized protein EAF01_005872 [Botrytis porri]|uniref:ferric-chelate reductase (NADPH) n=1 Tax=Botrytis porri TaxID=87229 RepID=A0A4Z1L4S3_9HELO|nr:uncharacterized protein EAF01_005872 [Botrytis porri]KAF7905351.1 hypothetical protein EAF01_005872 [Botrytis porri]TGO91824.1 hypothetical protein BPOR_0017g00060 [Botrytis porri]
MDAIEARHIQMADDTSTMEPHWGYLARVLPCTNDATSCEYLDAVYHIHDISMLYTFILWAVIGGILIILTTLHFIKPSGTASTKARDSEIQSSVGNSSWYYRAWRGTTAAFRRYLLPECFIKFFGHVTRLQVLILAIILGYLLIFTFVGEVYKTWMTPVKKSTLFSTRSGLGGFSDRLGAFAYALTPFTVLLSTRESVLTLATGIPYQSFNFLHRWIGRVIFIQSAVHTFGWTLIEARLYQPQPTTWQTFIKQPYIIWGCFALSFVCFLYVFSIRRVIQWTGYEFFRKTHYVVACLYIGACWGHWQQLKCWMIASLGLFFIDRGVRILRTLLIHVGYFDASGNAGLGFHPAQSTLQYFDDKDGGVIRLEFNHKHAPWALGQHFFLCFPALSIWQSHPITVASVPSDHHTYIIRCRSGETGNLKKLALDGQLTTPVILSGPYGEQLLRPTEEPTNILAIAGGTGISLTLPLVLAATASDAKIYEGRAIDFVWIVRRSSCLDWIREELEEVKGRARDAGMNLNIHIFITQEEDPDSEGKKEATITNDEKTVMEMDDKAMVNSISSLSPEGGSGGFKVSYLGGCQCFHPDLKQVVNSFMQERAGNAYRTRVIASGPNGMGKDLRIAVAKCNDGCAVLRGGKKGDVELVWDARD